MKQISVLVVLVFLILGCEPKLKPEKPSNLIPKDKMTLVLYDLFVVNSAKGINRKVLEENRLNPERYLLEKHSIDSVQFAESNNYYAHDIEVYNTIIDDVKQKITSEKKKYEAISEKSKEKKEQIKDSIKRSREVIDTKPLINRRKKAD